MKNNDIDSVIQQFLSGKAGSFTDKEIPLTDAMIERIEHHAKDLGITMEQAASVLLWNLLMEIERKTNRIKKRMMN